MKQALYGRFIRYLLRHRAIVRGAERVLGSTLVNNSWPYRVFCQSLARRHNESRPYGNLHLSLETTLACNAKCLMCTRAKMTTGNGVMKEPVFRKVVAEAKALGVKKINLSVYGEPMLDPHILDRAQQVNDAGIPISFFSNGSLLSERHSEALLRMPKLTLVNFSVNGHSKEVYERVMAGLDRDKVYANILRFLQLKLELKRTDVRVRISCVPFEMNRHDLDELSRFWRNQAGVDLVYFFPFRNRASAGLDVEQKEGQVEFSPLAARRKRLLPCKYLWEDIFVYWNGDVGVCCEDNAARRIVVGNVSQESLASVWNGPAMKALRQLHVEDRRKEHKVCGKLCTFNSVWLKPSESL